VRLTSTAENKSPHFSEVAQALPRTCVNFDLQQIVANLLPRQDHLHPQTILKKMSKRFLDQDALNYNPRKPGADKHISKHKARNKALEIVFDPKSHK
jgi:hypothetical protein